MNGRTIVDRLSPGMVEREPETIAAWIDAALAQARAEENESCAAIAYGHLCHEHCGATIGDNIRARRTP